ncbi:MAG: hypothetical protein ACI923_001827 [Flavobacteriales bacterium]|jgi:hypothetical protein
MNLSWKIILVVTILELMSCSVMKTKTHDTKITSGKHFDAKYTVIRQVTGIDIGRNKGSITLKHNGTMEIIAPTGAIEGGAEYMTLTHKYGIHGDTIFANGPFYNETKYLMNKSKDSIKMVYPEKQRNWTYSRTTANKK